MIADLYGLEAIFGFSAGLSFTAFIIALIFLKETVDVKGDPPASETSIVKSVEVQF